MQNSGKPSKSSLPPDNAAAEGELTHQLSAGINIATAGFILLAIAALYFGRDIFVPFALAVLLSFLLARPVGWLRHIGLPRVAAVVLVVSAAVAMIGGVSILVGSQAVNLANNLPLYQSTMLEKVRSIRSSAPGGGIVDRTGTVIKEIGRELSSSEDSAAEEKPVLKKRQSTEPIPVRVEEPEQSPTEIISDVLGAALGPIATAGLVIVFVFFMLLSPGDLRDRFIRLSGGDLHRTTEALNEAAERVSRYLLMQLVVNATFGIPLGIGLYLIGVPGAFLWALMATLLRFIPYLGPVISAVFPLTMAFVVDPGWDMLFWTAGLIIVLELISNNIIEPWLYGSSTGMTPMAVILSAIFWTLLWGPVGLMIATPITVCMVVIGRYVPQLKFIDVLLGSEPVLSSDERLYQRLLGGNVEEVIDIAENESKNTSLLEFYDHAALAALRLAENDRDRGASKEEHRQVAEGLRSMAQAMGDVERKQEEGAETAERWLGTPVLSIAGRGQLDGAASMLLGKVLSSRGIGARVVPASEIALESIASLDLAGVEIVCLSYLSPDPRAYARFVCRRLKTRKENLKIVLGLWNLSLEAGAAEKLARNLGADAAATSLTEATGIIEHMLGQSIAPAMAPPMPAEEEARLEALAASGALHAENSEYLDQIASRIAAAMDAPIGLVSLIDNSSQVWKGAAGLPDKLQEVRQAPREMSICTYVVAADAPLVVEDIARDSRFAQNSFLREHGLRFYAGVPLRTGSGHVIGSLCVIDVKPRMISSREIKLMQVVADELMTELSNRIPIADKTPDIPVVS